MTLQKEKNPVLAAVLGALLGPFGLLYVSLWQAGLGFLVVVVAALVSCGTGGLAAPVFIIAYAIWGYLAATNYNQWVERTNRAAMEQAAMQQAFQYGAPPQLGAGPASPSHLDGTPQSVGDVSLGQVPSPAAQNVVPMACAACGAALKPGATFCGSCGTPVRKGDPS